jgi:hypothetical protein
MLEHLTKRESTIEDGKAVILKDMTVYTESEPRSSFAWIVEVLHHNGTVELFTLGAKPKTVIANTSPILYSDANYGTATHFYIPLPDDGYYTVKSALVPRKDILTGTAVNGNFVADPLTGVIERVETAVANPDTTYTYTFSSGYTVEDLIAAGHAVQLYPVLSICELIHESDRLNLSYVQAGTQPSCAQRLAALRQNGCSNGGPERTMLRNLYFDIAYQISGAEISFNLGLKHRVLANLSESRALVEQMQTLIGR